MELSGDDNTYQRTFAGDTYNTAVYAKRCHDHLDVQMLTAIGTDPISEAMLAQWDKDQVGHDLVMLSSDAHPGIYAISTDQRGERSFTYWRKYSAAVELMSLMTDDIRQKVKQFHTIYFSGISLAILSEHDKAALLDLIADLKAQGSTIAFDPNYRAALWQDAHYARQWLTRAYRLADIAFPGLADHREIYGHDSREVVAACLQELGVPEIVLKADDAGVLGYLHGQDPVHQSVRLDSHPKDTTGAGDSFAGTYLAERLVGASMSTAIRSASAVAGLVVQHHGAIIDSALYRNVFPKDS